MDEGVRLLFKRALDGEPALPAGEMARGARAAGRRLRRRRGLAVGAAAGVIAVLAGVAVVATLPQPAADRTPPGDPTTRPVAMMMPDPACTFPAYDDATHAVIFLRLDVTDRQRSDLDATVRSDRRVRDVRFESAQEAYDQFARLYSDAPDLVGSVKIDQVPESFRVTLAEPPAFAGFAKRFGGARGVDEIIGFRCPEGVGR